MDKEVDPLDSGLIAVLSTSQESDSTLHQVAYASRKLQTQELQCTVLKKCLTIIQAVKYSYLYRQMFILLTDRKPLS